MNPRLYQVFLDMDGVVANWDDPGVQSVGIDPYDPKIRAIFKRGHNSDGKIVDELVGPGKLVPAVSKLGVPFWAEMIPPLEWAHELVNRISKIEGTEPPCYVTNYSQWPEACVGKLIWLKKHFNSNRVIFTASKHLAANPRNFLVDDKRSNVEEFVQFGARGYLWPHQYLLQDGDISLLDTIEEVVKAIEVSRDLFFESVDSLENAFEPRMFP